MSSAESYDASGIEYYNIPSFTFASGTTLHDVKVAYKSISPNSTHGSILIPTCYGGLVSSTLGPFWKAHVGALVLVSMTATSIFSF